jgi:hypothetical protein
MNENRVKQIRQRVSDCMECGADALFNLADALWCESHAYSLPDLSVSLCVELHWPSASDALEDGQITVEQRRAFWVKALVKERAESEPIWVGVETSHVERATARTSADRTIIHLPTLPLVDTAIRLGWTCSSVVVIPQQVSCGTSMLDQKCVSREHTAIEAAIGQRQARRPLCGTRPVLMLADRWSSTPEFLRACHALGSSVRIRLTSHHTHSRVPVRIHTRGAPPTDGLLFQGTRPETPGTADEVCQQPASGGTVQISRWTHWHVQQDRQRNLAVITAERGAATGSTRDPRVNWFVMRDAVIPLSQVTPHAGRRFSQEHGSRFLKHERLWTRVLVRTPVPCERWRWLVALARELGPVVHRSWERSDRPITPLQVCRMMPTMMVPPGTPARPCQPRGQSPGRAKGFRPQPAVRFPVVWKTINVPLNASG